MASPGSPLPLTSSIQPLLALLLNGQYLGLLEELEFFRTPLCLSFPFLLFFFSRSWDSFPQHHIPSMPMLSKFSSPPWTALLPCCSPLPGSPASHPHSPPQHRKHNGSKLNLLVLTFNQFLSQLNPIVSATTNTYKFSHWIPGSGPYFPSFSHPWKCLSICH